MRRRWFGFAAVLTFAVLVPAGRASAQAGSGVMSDPFSFYYGYYLPHQQYMANQSTPTDTLNQIAATRQVTSQTDRTTLYDPISPYGADEESDQFRPSGSGGRGAGMGRPAKPQGFSFGTGATNTRGTGPADYYNRTARYFPTLRTGRGPNQNLGLTRGHRGGGMGMPSMGNSFSMPAVR